MSPYPSVSFSSFGSTVDWSLFLHPASRVHDDRVARCARACAWLACAAIATCNAAALAQVAQDTPPTEGGAGAGAGEAPAAAPTSSPSASLPAVGVQVAGGNGFALSADGRSRLHLGIDAGVGFDTNPYSVPLEEAGFSGDLTTRIRPRATVDYPGSTLSFDGNAMVDYGFLAGVIDPGTRNLLLYQSLLSADIELNRGGALRFAVGDTFSWNSDPGLASVGLIFNRIHNQLRAGGGLRPGGGALDFKLGYTLDIIKYLDVDNTGFGAIAEGDLDSMLNTVIFRTDYKFLPRTGFFGSVAVGYNVFDPFGVGGATPNPQAFPLTALVGVQGQVLAKVAGLASVGYSNPFIVDDSGLATGGLIGVVGQGELQWAPSPHTRLGGGFQRSFAPAPLYQYFGHNRFYLSLNQLLAGRFALNINSGYSILEFGEEVIPLSDQTEGRLDGHLDALVGLTFFFTDWFSLGISDKLDWRLTNASSLSTDPSVPSVNFGFIRNQTFLVASLAY